MKTISALTLRKKMGALLDEVSNNKEEIIVSRANQPIAAIIPIEEFNDKRQKILRRGILREKANKIDEWRRKFGSNKESLTTTEIIRKMRDGAW